MIRLLLAVLGLILGLFLHPLTLAEELNASFPELNRRDPFSLVLKPRCPREIQDEGLIISSWRLRGVIGQQSDQRGWIQAPSGEWLKVFLQVRLPVAHWQISRIGYGTVLFSPAISPASRCSSTPSIELNIRK